MMNIMNSSDISSRKTMRVSENKNSMNLKSKTNNLIIISLD